MVLLRKISFICLLVTTITQARESSRRSREMVQRNNPAHLGLVSVEGTSRPSSTMRTMATRRNHDALRAQSRPIPPRLQNPPAEPLQPSMVTVQPERLNNPPINNTPIWTWREFSDEWLRSYESSLNDTFFNIPSLYTPLLPVPSLNDILPPRHSFEHLCPDQKKHDLTLLTMYSFGLYSEPEHYGEGDFQLFLHFLEPENREFSYLYEHHELEPLDLGAQTIQKVRPPVTAGSRRPRETRTLKQLYEDHDFFQYFDESIKITFEQYACDQSLKEPYKWNKLFDKIKQRLNELNRVGNIPITMRKFGIPQAAPGVDREFIDVLIPKFRILVEGQALRLRQLLKPTEDFVCDYLMRGLEYNFRSFSFEEVKKFYRVYKGIESFEETSQNPTDPASNPLFRMDGFTLEIFGNGNRFTPTRTLPLREKILLAYYGDDLKNQLDQRLEINEQRPEEHRGKDALGILSYYYDSASIRSRTLNIPRNAIWDNFDSYCGRHTAPTRNFVLNYIVENFQYADPQNANQFRRFNEQEAAYLLDEIMFMNLS